MPCVSVIVPTYNRSDCLPRCLDSLVDQTINNFEVFVCDDGSKDNSREIVERYKDKLKLEYHWRENFGGPAKPRNLGIRLSRAPFVAFLDSDDWWSPSKLEKSISFLEAGADIVYHDLFVAHSEHQKYFWRRLKTRQLIEPVFNDLLERGNGLNNSSVVVRRELLEKINGFSEEKELISWEDYDCWLRLSKHTERFVRIKQTLGFYSVYNNNLSSPERELKNLKSFQRKFLGGYSIHFPEQFNYELGRVHYELKNYKEAKYYYHKVIIGNHYLKLKLKSVLFYCFTSLKKIFN